MEKRRLGRTEHMSTIAIFGGAAFWNISQEKADTIFEKALEYGVNHVDVAPEYGDAELRIGPLMERHRGEVFLACKTLMRTKKEAWEELHRSLERLRVDHFDLYQLHSVDNLEELDTALGPDGAMEAILEARQQGLVRFIGITGHRPDLQVEALNRFDFDTVMLPLNFVLSKHRQEENDYEPLLNLAREKNVGVMAIKAVAKGSWKRDDRRKREDRPYRTWYEPFDAQEMVDNCLWYVLSQGVTAAITPGDGSLVGKVLDAAERFKPLSPAQQEQLVAKAAKFEPLFPRSDFG